MSVQPEGQEEIPEPETVTEQGLLAELRRGEYRGLGQENLEDLNRIESQLRDEVIAPILLARYIGVRPQMVYQAIREGKLTAVDLNNTQKKYIRLNEALRYAARYLTRRQARELEKLREERTEQLRAS
jgi:hypothetical protein